MRFYTVKQLRLHLSELVLVRAEMVPSVSRLAACKKARKLWGVPCYDVITAREASKEPVTPLLTDPTPGHERDYGPEEPVRP